MRTIEYGFLLTYSVNWPPWSCPTYPGGLPICRKTYQSPNSSKKVGKHIPVSKWNVSPNTRCHRS